MAALLESLSLTLEMGEEGVEDPSFTVPIFNAARNLHAVRIGSDMALSSSKISQFVGAHLKLDLMFQAIHCCGRTCDIALVYNGQECRGGSSK
jgi:hypothetical protein